MTKFLIVITGPTGVGKTDLSIEIANHFNTEIISSDSRQIYKELRIGTAVPFNEQLQQVKHHFIGSQSIHDYYNASMFEMEVLKVLENIFQQKEIALMTGGSGLYVNAVCKGIDELPTIEPEIRKNLITQYEKDGIESLRIQLKRCDPDYYEKVDLRNPKRLLKAIEVFLMTGKPYTSFLNKEKNPRIFKPIKIALNRDRTELYERINLRVNHMIQEGLVDEARKFLKEKELNALNTVGYKELFQYFEEKITLERAIDLIKRDTRRYAKSQISWINRDKEFKWFHPEDKKEIIQYIDEHVN